MKLPKCAMIILSVSAAIAMNGTLCATAEGSLGVYLNETLPRELSDENSDMTETLLEYVDRTLPYCLAANELYGSYDFFAPIRLQDWDGDGDLTDKYWIVVSRDNKTVGYLMITRVEDRLVSGFCPQNIPPIDKALSDRAEIRLGYRDGCLILSDGEHFTVLEGIDGIEPTLPDAATVEREDATVLEEGGTAFSERLVIREDHSVSTIRAVPNEKSDHRHLLCWAACVASMGGQIHPETEYSARGVYLLCSAWRLYAAFLREPICSCKLGSEWDEPHGCDPWIKYSLSLVGHTVVLYRFVKIDDSSGLYLFMDPGMGESNCGSVTAVIDRATMKDGNDLILPSVTGTYMNWYGSFYAVEDDE
ncbi:MAG: hypothetical protein NC084_08980 [Bacteroides sp.]|nr:hypothetical protein [Eubacterium sp.]MCM1418348.1 hypothetical protein [Roseburia sp.]MCM1462830.1 hypothetical protein [Bacteroides sp.]